MLSKLFNLPWPPGFFWPDCPCCLTGPCATFKCGDPDPSPVTWEFAIAGITNGTCTDCSNLNRTYTLVDNPVAAAGCHDWEELGIDPGVNCSTGFPPVTFVRLRCQFCLSGDGSKKWQVQIFIEDNSLIALYEKSGNLNCCGDNVFDRITVQDSNCNDLPLTITLTPSGATC